MLTDGLQVCWPNLNEVTIYSGRDWEGKKVPFLKKYHIRYLPWCRLLRLLPCSLSTVLLLIKKYLLYTFVLFLFLFTLANCLIIFFPSLLELKWESTSDLLSYNDYWFQHISLDSVLHQWSVHVVRKCRKIFKSCSKIWSLLIQI